MRNKFVWPCLVFILFLSGSVSVFAVEAASAPAAPAVPSPAASQGNAKAQDQSAAKAGGVKLRVVAVNPSKEKVQKVPIKIYLPKEIIPDDIIKMNDMQVAYDSEKALYYAYNEGAELKPQETRIFEVMLEDVWHIPNEELAKIRMQTSRALKLLETTEHFANAKAIVDSIDSRLNEMEAKQSDLTISREDHIGAYRTNLRTMGQVKEDIAILEKMLQHTGAPPSIELLKDTVFENKKDMDRITAWRLIMAIVGFLFVVGAAFYIRWFLVIRSSRSKPGLKGAPVIPVSEFVDEHTGTEKVDLGQLIDSQQDSKRKTG